MIFDHILTKSAQILIIYVKKLSTTCQKQSGMSCSQNIKKEGKQKQNVKNHKTQKQNQRQKSPRIFGILVLAGLGGGEKIIS